ncbi:MAG: hypothetical protein ACRC92_16830, partial [Peptostreptococcaceae bacterium]
DELEHKIITLNNKRYLEISYSDEPEKIYLWVTDKNKVEKLYTGILKNISTNKMLVDTKQLEAWYDYNLNSPFLLEIGAEESIVPNDYLKWHRGGVTRAWNAPEKHIQYEIDIDGKSVTGKSSGGTSSFEVNVDTLLSVRHINILGGNGYKFLLTPKVEFEKITLYYRTAANQGNNTPYYKDTIIIYGKKNNLYFEKTDMDFGEFSKTEGKTAESKISVFNSKGIDYKLDIPNSINITNNDLQNNTIPVFLEMINPTQKSDSVIHYIKGVIKDPKSLDGVGEYIQGRYTGTIPVTITINENTKGGRF